MRLMSIGVANRHRKQAARGAQITCSCDRVVRTAARASALDSPCRSTGATQPSEPMTAAGSPAPGLLVAASAAAPKPRGKAAAASDARLPAVLSCIAASVAASISARNSMLFGGWPAATHDTLRDTCSLADA